MIRSDLRTYLLAQSSVADLIGTRLSLSRLPLNVDGSANLSAGPFPCVTYRLASANHHHNLDGGQGYCEAAIELDVWGDDSEEVEAAGDAIRLKLQGYLGAMGNSTVKRSTLDEEQDFFHPPQDGSDTGIHRTTFRYTIGFYEAITAY